MKITQRLEGRARTVARAARDLGRGPAGDGPQAVYARVLDGERLWLALDAGAGEPALRRVDTGEVLDPVSELPRDHDAHEPGFHSVRWLLTTALPETDDATFEVVVRPAGGGGLQQVRAPQPHPESPARAGTTPDGRWRFVLDTGDGGLRVRRTALPPASRLIAVSAAHGDATVVCETAGRERADLLLLDNEGVVAVQLPMERTDAGFVRTLSDADLPAASGGYSVAIGSPEDHVPVTRRHADLHLPDPTNVLLPMLTDEDGDRVSGRLRFSPNGALRVQRVATGVKEGA